jgi:type I restriction enzyme S subunit
MLINLIKKIFTDFSNCSIQESLPLNKLKNIKIPIPKKESKIKSWTEKISKPYDLKYQKEEKLNNLEKEVQDEINRITEEEDCEEKDLCDVCEYIKSGKNKTPDNKKGTKYPYYGTSEITGYTDHFLFDGEFILIARNGTMGNCFKSKGKIYPSDHIFVIKPLININYFFYLINLNSKYIDSLSNGSTIKGISKINLSKLIIKIPKDKKLIEALEPKFKKIETLKEDIEKLDIEYKQYIQELADEAIPPELNQDVDFKE